MKKIFSFFIDIIAPKKCYSCQKEGHFLCPECLQKRRFYKPICYICKKESNNFLLHLKCKKENQLFRDIEKVIVLTYYRDSVIAKCIKEAKYYKKKEILEEFIHSLKEKLFNSENIQKKEDFIITAPPMHILKKWKRGYNHSALLGRLLGGELGILFEEFLVKKNRYTKQQSRLSKYSREENIKNSFTFNKKNRSLIQGKTIIIVDDVISTGATIGEISRVLKENGAKRIIALAIASD